MRMTSLGMMTSTHVDRVPRGDICHYQFVRFLRENICMTTLNVSEARANLYKLIDDASVMPCAGCHYR